MNKKGIKTAQKVFWPAFGWAQQPKVGRNTQELELLYVWYKQPSKI